MLMMSYYGGDDGGDEDDDDDDDKVDWGGILRVQLQATCHTTASNATCSHLSLFCYYYARKTDDDDALWPHDLCFCEWYRCACQSESKNVNSLSYEPLSILRAVLVWKKGLGCSSCLQRWQGGAELSRVLLARTSAYLEGAAFGMPGTTTRNPSDPTTSKSQLGPLR